MNNEFVNENGAKVYISIGSNIEPEHYVRAALTGLEKYFGRLQCSTVYQTKAVGFDGPDFLNMVVGFKATDDVYRVNQLLNDLERANGRKPNAPRFAARTLDLDLLLYDNLQLNEPGLTLPRAEILKYAFVLKPLAEIAPNQRHPDTGYTFTDHWQQFADDQSSLIPVKL